MIRSSSLSRMPLRSRLICGCQEAFAGLACSVAEASVKLPLKCQIGLLAWLDFQWNTATARRVLAKFCGRFCELVCNPRWSQSRLGNPYPPLLN